MKLSGLLNAFTLAGIVGVGAYQIKEAQAVELVNYFGKEQKHCLQQNIFFEARNQSTIGQISVAWVTLNRVDDHRYPDTICDVVWQKSAFSWTADGKPDTPSNNILEQQAWELAGQLAEETLLDWARGNNSPVENAVMYHADYVDPYWSSSYDHVTQIDSHIFYQ